MLFLKPDPKPLLLGLTGLLLRSMDAAGTCGVVVGAEFLAVLLEPAGKGGTGSGSTSGGGW
jgi:hypothetical protein